MPLTSAGLARSGASLAVAGLLVLAACGSGDDSPTSASDATVSTAAGAPAPTSPAPPAAVLAVTVRGGAVVEGTSRQGATLNQLITIRVTSDVADEVHVHGYEKRVAVAAGATSAVTFLANIAGVFEVELEKSGKLLFTMAVR